MIGSLLGWIGGFFKNLTSVILGFISDLFVGLFNGIVYVLKLLFKPILILVALIFYFISKLAELVVLLITLLLAIGKLVYSFVMGVFNTLAGLSWSATPPSHGSWSAQIAEVFIALEPYQLDKLAYVLAFVIWITTALGAIKILTRGGGA